MPTVRSGSNSVGGGGEGQTRTILIQPDQLIEIPGGAEGHQLVVVNSEDGQEFVQINASDYSQLVAAASVQGVTREEAVAEMDEDIADEKEDMN